MSPNNLATRTSCLAWKPRGRASCSDGARRRQDPEAPAQRRGPERRAPAGGRTAPLRDRSGREHGRAGRRGRRQPRDALPALSLAGSPGRRGAHPGARRRRVQRGRLPPAARRARAYGADAPVGHRRPQQGADVPARRAGRRRGPADRGGDLRRGVPRRPRRSVHAAHGRSGRWPSGPRSRARGSRPCGWSSRGSCPAAS